MMPLMLRVLEPRLPCKRFSNSPHHHRASGDQNI